MTQANTYYPGFIAVALASIAGCVIPTELEQLKGTAQYREVADLAEVEVEKDSRTYNLLPLCDAYANLKKYDRLLSCLERLDRNVTNGDRNGLNPTHSIPIAAGAFVDAERLALQMRAEAYLELGDYDAAISSAEKIASAPLHIPPTRAASASAARRKLDNVLRSYGILGLAYAYKGNMQEARSYARRIENIRSTKDAPASRFDEKAPVVLAEEKQLILSRLWMALGEYESALNVMKTEKGELNRALASVTASATSLGRYNNNLFAYLDLPQRYMFAKSALETGRVQLAKEEMDKLFAISRTTDNGAIYWLLLYDRGTVARREGDTHKAIEYLERAVSVVEEQRSTINTEVSKIGFIGDKQNLYRDLIGLLVDEGQIAQAFAYVERAKARALVDTLATKTDFAIPSGNAEQVRALLETIETVGSDVRARDSTENLAKSRGLLVSARQQLATQSPELASLVSVNVSEASEIQRELPGDETLIEYYYSGKNLYAFVVTREMVSGIRLTATKLDDDVQAFRKSLQAGDPRWKADSVRLYERLIKPIKEQLRSRNVTIVAHGSLHYLPFNALHDGSQFLVEGYSIRLLPAATVLKFLKAPLGEKPGMLLAFGNPDLKDRRYDLAFAQAEAQSIVRVLPKSRALTRREATKTAFRKYATDFRMLHVASHGEFDPDRPLASSLLLAPDAGSDGRLTVGDLYSMHVDADLVTLSACETGLGKIANGDDVVGLTRGFLYAGARTVVASLWQVDDRATGELMTAFYDALAKGVGKREALRAAQVGFLKRQPEPFFWAAFQLTGSP